MKRLLIILTIFAMPSVALADGYFGLDSAFTGVGTAVDTNACYGNRVSALTRTSDGTETIDTLIAWIHDNSAASKLVIGIYSYAGGNPAKQKFVSDTLTLTTNNTMQREVIPCSFALTTDTVYTLTLDVIYTGVSSAPGIGTTSLASAASQDSFNLFQANWSNIATPGIRMALAAHWSTTAASITIDTLTQIDSTTSSAKIRYVYTGPPDSSIIWVDTDNTFSGATRFAKSTHASPDTVDITALNTRPANPDYRWVWVRLWTATLQDSDSLYVHTKYINYRTGLLNR
jgi:hypothetical protein